MRLKQGYWNLRDFCRQYGKAIVCAADGNPLGLVSNACRISVARSRHDIMPWLYSLYGLSEVPMSRWGDYLVDYADFLQRLRQQSPPEMAKLAKDKVAFHRHCVLSELPTIPILCVVESKTKADAQSVPGDLPDMPARIDGPRRWQTFLESAPSELFVKPLDGLHGDGAFPVSHIGSDYEFGGRIGSGRALFDYLKESSPQFSGWIVQPRMKNDPRLGGLVPANGLTTMRVVTSMRDGGARIVAALLKIIAGNNVIDNFSGSTTGNLVAAIDPESGALNSAAGSIRRDWPQMRRFAHHPDTGGRIEGFELPFWNEAKLLALRAQASLPRFKSVGWDIAATEHGVMIVEANASYDVSIVQAAHGRGMKKEMLEAIGSASKLHLESCMPLF